MTKNTKSGYGKPPKDSQWKPGQSGNPKGRPKKTEQKYTRQEIIKELFEETIEIRDANGTCKISRQEAYVRKVFSLAMQGSSPALKLLEKWSSEIELKEKKDAVSGVLVVPPQLSLQEVLEEAKKHREKFIEDEAKFREEQDAKP